MSEAAIINSFRKNRVAVVGAGVVSPLGLGRAETAASLRSGQDCISNVTRFSTASCRCKIAGQVPDQRLSDIRINIKRPNRLHRVSRMMILALGEALEQTPDFQPELSVLGTTSGGMTFGEEFYRNLKGSRKSNRSNPSLIANYTPQKAAMDAQETL